MLPTLDTPYVYFEIKNNILYATYKKGVEVNLYIAKQIVQLRLHFMAGREMPVIVFDEGVVRFTKEARDYFGSAEGNRGLKAGAIILRSPVANVMSNFFLFVTGPSIPARAFTRVDKALKWLSKFK